MHEFSLVRSLLDQVAGIARANPGHGVDSIELELGPLSGVEPDLVASAFMQLAPEAGLSGARLVLEEVALSARCHDCGRSFEVREFDFRCPHGCSAAIHIERGDGCIVKRVTLVAEQVLHSSESTP